MKVLGQVDVRGGQLYTVVWVIFVVALFSQNSQNFRSIPKRVDLLGVTDTRLVNFNKGWHVYIV